MAESNELQSRNIASAVRNTAFRQGLKAAALIGSLVMLFLALSTSGIFASEEQNGAYEKVVAHGGGAYKGYETTNSVEALNHAIASGYKIIELDMELSSDNKIIMLHDWDRTAMHYYGTSFPKKLSQSSFMKLSVYGELEVLTFDKLAAVLAKNPDIRIITDTKGDNLELLSVIREKYPDMTDRLIPQIYDYDQWQKVKELGYSDIIFTLYAMAEVDTDKLASFVREHGIYAVTMPDYIAERGICRQLSDAGVVVYVHPVSSFEDAQRFMKQGAFGVYSGTLLPEEFAGIEKDYYFTVSDTGGSAVKLTDERIDDWKELGLYGLKPQDTVSYDIDRSGSGVGYVPFASLKPGKHELAIQIYSGREHKGTLTYYLWKDTDHIRVLHKKYEYRLDAVRQEKDFHTVMRNEAVSDEAREILERSLIAKEGEYSFYFDGNLENYMNGEEFLPVQNGSYGKLLLPLNTTLRKLGASSVTMSAEKDLTIIYRQKKSMIMANTGIIRRGFLLERLNSPVTLYLNKAMAGGEFYRSITGRDYLEQDGCLIILPGDAKPDEALKKQLLAAAGKLFQGIPN